jgi:tetratricopeptide (TPR) repeat protein
MGLCNEEKYEEALTMFNDVVAKFPEFNPHLVYYGMSIAYDGLGREDEAISSLEWSIHYKPDFIEATITLGSLYGRVGRLDEAVNMYHTVVTKQPDHELAQNLQGAIREITLLVSGDAMNRFMAEMNTFRQQAAQQFKISLDFSPKSVAILNALIDQGWNTSLPEGKAIHRIASVYFGESLVRSLKGQWRLAHPFEDIAIVGLPVTVKPFKVLSRKWKEGQAFDLIKYMIAVSKGQTI